MLKGTLRIGIDIGGTFTDIQVLEQSTGRCFSYKTPTTPADPSEGLMEGILGASQRYDFALDQVQTLMHGTTIATNAVLQDKLPRTCLVTTQGFRDVLEIGRHVRRDVYAARAESRRLLVPRADRFEVQERLGPQGQVLTPLNIEEMETVARTIAESAAQAVAVCFMHAYANAQHEHSAGEMLARYLPHDYISLSHSVSPELREYERMSTTVLNAALMPVVKAYIVKLQERMRTHDFHPALYLVQSNGGVTTPDMAAEQPARLLLSGPSGGALAAETLAHRLTQPDLVAMDMGGTSFDVSVVSGGITEQVTQSEVDGCPVRLPMIEIRTIGAGGGSIASVDETGRLHVGPDSAGASPGPVSYGHGGVEPTVTDANVVLGRIDAEFFLGGAMRLDEATTKREMRERIANRLALSNEDAALGIIQVAVSSMAAAIRLSLFEKGLDPRDFSLTAFGGAGGLHAAEVALELGAKRLIYPRDAGTLSAWGILFSDIVYDGARSNLLSFTSSNSATIQSLIDDLYAEGRAKLDGDSVAANAQRFELSADMRYQGQAYEIVVPINAMTMDDCVIDETTARFHTLHQTRFAHSNVNDTPELVTMRLSAVGALEKPKSHEREQPHTSTVKGTRKAYFDNAWVDTPVFARDAVGIDGSVRGPALIEEDYATIVIPQGFIVRCTEFGDLIAEAS